MSHHYEEIGPVSSKPPGNQPSNEVRVVNEKTGGAKGSKDERFDLIPYEALAEIARVYGMGAKKYDSHNWRKGYDWGLSYAALMRHITAFWNGEDIDPESGLPHMAHAGWHCLTLLTFMKDHRDLDDRYSTIHARHVTQKVPDVHCDVTLTPQATRFFEVE